MKILIGTNHLEGLSGSEIVTYEFAKYFISLGHTVDVFANWAGFPVAGLFSSDLNIKIETDEKSIHPLDYDLVYFQHQVAGLFNYEYRDTNKTHTAIVFGRLSRRSFFESGGWAFDNVIGDATIANSELTKDRLIETGVKHPVSSFYNAAPEEFSAPRRCLPAAPKKILVVTNNRSASLLGAIVKLRNVADVLHLGRSGDLVRKVQPEDIWDADLVISIGKTIQYGLVAHIPVFVYDHFGGPGYLSDENFRSAALYSFTGRCCERQSDAENLFAEIMSAYPQGKAFAEKDNEELFQKYRLNAHLDQLLAIPASSNAERRQRIQKNRAALALETMMANYVRTAFIDAQNERNRAEKADERSTHNSRIEELEAAHAALLSSNSWKVTAPLRYVATKSRDLLLRFK